MKCYRLKIIILFLSILLTHKLFLANSFQENYFTPEKILRFAEYLYQEGDYLRAAGEFERYLYSFFSLLPETDSIYYKIGLCYRLGKDFQKSINYFQKVINNYPQSSYLYDSYYQVGYTFFSIKKYKESISFLNDGLPLIESDTKRLKMQQLVGLNYIYQKQWNEAINFLNSSDEAKKNTLSNSLINFAKEGEQLPRKSKLLAGFMSAIIPGTGKMYCHRTVDGFFSLLTIGLTGWRAYEGFQKKGVNSVKGWIFGTISAFLYFGNIYGSVVAVSIYNQQLENKLLEKVGVTINVYFK